MYAARREARSSLTVIPDFAGMLTWPAYLNSIDLYRPFFVTLFCRDMTRR